MRAKTKLLSLSVGAAVGALLFALPATAMRPDLPPEGASTVPPEVVVSAGETLSSIAAGMGLTWEQFAGWDHLSNPNLIAPGLLLPVPPADYVPPAPPPPPPAPAPRAVVAESYVSHTSVSTGPSGWPVSCYGITNPDALWIIARESGCNVYAHNPSGACGIGQRMDRCDGYNGYAQAADMTSYVMGRYGSWSAARSFWEAHRWY